MRKIVVLCALISLSAVAAVTTTPKEAELLAQAREYRLTFREGNMQTVQDMVARLEEAVREYPQSIKLWNALGGAYFARLSASYVGHADPDKRFEFIEQARHAYARAMRIDATHAEALAGHGMALVSSGLMKQDLRSLSLGTEELNRAVDLDPSSRPARLMRAFTLINLPPAHRDTSIVIGDLTYLIREVPGSRAEAMLHLLRGDLYAETGQLEAAAREYDSISRAYRFPAEQARARLQLLKQAKPVSPADMGNVRGALTYACAACHARGTDE
jgi:tetratricopeptide (TPR) repeat protein